MAREQKPLTQNKAATSRARRGTGVGRPKLSVAAPDAELRIREAALELFSTRGFSSVTTKDIADATGFNPALIYYYFGSKEELFRRAVSLAVERAFEQFRISRQGRERPRDIIYGWLDTHILQFGTIAKLVMISIDYAKTAKRKSRLDEVIHRFYDEERDVLRQTLSAGVRSGDFRDVDVDETATFISTYLDGVFVRSVILKKFDPLAAIRQLRAFLDAHLKP
ncbi:TetR/AcrR family transcriptional regulator [Hyphomicrobium sp. CS1GBMeth3]|uniref:TetR/AcrR family transcriptional regulator n=1 Tax=Hyphomicrobium sp. CS1GBMeth3 TaxID=1892845 RepID=UPI0009305C8B|nr:TetR/AcrR family transcriptional regulator [Hyphomicrobium sp. CS1GBMeth3]